ncbi:hypothetical protein JAAARDRAFT_139587 [Jaapia argillacea MUCL 33604]|uniref:PHP domain-like protein n=1 Tax=Jaapia argillacea MUCL 33604 TaxID=933084 RepID=A0A067PDD2_9AGAM|nr:hypothetical protein JAAARDRAFT_139587 [Jaapia argillacea MUCL 33604]
MFFDLNVPVSSPSLPQSSQSQSKKAKGKQPASTQPTPTVTYTPAQITSIESRIDLLVHLGYSVFALNQTVQRKVEPKTHINTLDPLLSLLKKRSGAVFLKRLTIILDEESEKGFGLTSSNASLFNAYDLIALTPTTSSTFSSACLTHSVPSPLTAHIISIPLTLPRLPFYLKHTLVRTAIKNGAVFEINYVGAMGGDDGGGGEVGVGAKKNWWAAAREIVRVTKGKGIIVSGGVGNETDLRSPKDIGNLITLLDLPQGAARHTSTSTPKSLVLRAQTRKTYRAVLSEPRLVIPAPSLPDPAAIAEDTMADTEMPTDQPTSVRPLDSEAGPSQSVAEKNEDASGRKKKRKKKNKDSGDGA